MTTKDELLKLFETNKGIYYNGEQIAAKLGVSRNAIWKAVTALRETVLGHRDIKTTLDIYADCTQEMLDKEFNSLEGSFRVS